MLKRCNLIPLLGAERQFKRIVYCAGYVANRQDFFVKIDTFCHVLVSGQVSDVAQHVNFVKLRVMVHHFFNRADHLEEE